MEVSDDDVRFEGKKPAVFYAAVNIGRFRKLCENVGASSNMLTQCLHCGFFIKKSVEFCPNCGIHWPLVPPREISLMTLNLLRLLQSIPLKIIVSALLTGLTLLFWADWEFRNIPFLRDWVIFAAPIFGFGVPFVGFFLLSYFLKLATERKRRKKRDNLSSHLKTIDQRISDLDRRAQMMEIVMERIVEAPNPKLGEMSDELRAGHHRIVEQRDRYELQKRKIELVRIQNSMSPFLYGISEMSEFQLENGVVMSEQTRVAIEKLRVQVAETESTDARHFLRQLDETDHSCQRLHEALLSRQAERALSLASPPEPGLPVPAVDHLTTELEVFNAQAALTDFSDSFGTLEKEYEKLRADGEKR